VITESPLADDNAIVGTLVERSFRGGYYRLVIRHASGLHLSFTVQAISESLPPLGASICLSLRSEAISLLPRVQNW